MNASGVPDPQSLSEAREFLRKQVENRRAIAAMQTRGESYSRTWAGRVSARIVQLRRFIRLEERRELECIGKVKYPSEAAAEADLRRMRAHKTGLKHGSRLGTYTCQFCEQHHIGHQSSNRGRLPKKAKAA